MDKGGFFSFGTNSAYTIARRNPGSAAERLSRKSCVGLQLIQGAVNRRLVNRRLGVNRLTG
jgi:hypothetical protein